METHVNLLVYEFLNIKVKKPKTIYKSSHSVEKKIIIIEIKYTFQNKMFVSSMVILYIDSNPGIIKNL